MFVFALTGAVFLLLSTMNLVWELLTASRVGTEGHGLRLSFPREALHERCAPRSSELGSAGTTWSACQGSLGSEGLPHIQQRMVESLTCFARVA
jgi:hypothetical protein